MTTRLLIADDHEAVRLGLVNLLAGTGINIVGQATNGNECLTLAEKHKPAVILLDLRLPEAANGFKTLEKLRQKVPDSKVIMFTNFDNPTYIAQAAIRGASDYVLKSSPRKAIIEVIRAAAAGQSPSALGELRRMAETLNNREVIEDDKVVRTRRESQVVRHLALGLSNKEIGRSMEIGIETVKEHVQNVLRKLDAKDRVMVAIWAARKGVA
jgi:DNA-binding NarL/FixJ family response regulator